MQEEIIGIRMLEEIKSVFVMKLRCIDFVIQWSFPIWISTIVCWGNPRFIILRWVVRRGKQPRFGHPRIFQMLLWCSIEIPSWFHHKVCFEYIHILIWKLFTNSNVFTSYINIWRIFRYPDIDIYTFKDWYWHIHIFKCWYIYKFTS